MGLLTDDDRRLMEQVIARLAGLPDAMRQTLTDHLWASIPSTIAESAYSPSLAPGDLSVTSQTSHYERITTVVVAVPSGGTGLVTLGEVRMPVGAGTTVLQGLSIDLAFSDVRKLTTATATGAAALLLCGEQLPTYGVMAP